MQLLCQQPKWEQNNLKRPFFGEGTAKKRRCRGRALPAVRQSAERATRISRMWRSPSPRRRSSTTVNDGRRRSLLNPIIAFSCDDKPVRHWGGGLCPGNSGGSKCHRFSSLGTLRGPRRRGPFPLYPRHPGTSRRLCVPSLPL